MAYTLLHLICEVLIWGLWKLATVILFVAGMLNFISVRLIPDAPIPNGNILHLELPRRLPPVPDRQRGAYYVYCSWCGRDTVHVRRQHSRFVCVNSDGHSKTFAYRQLAARFSNAAEFPGCICAPGENSNNGRPDPECAGLAHRP